jgi:hypothetical protein
VGFFFCYFVGVDIVVVYSTKQNVRRQTKVKKKKEREREKTNKQTNKRNKHVKEKY